MSIDGWHWRLAKRGLALSLRPGNRDHWIASVTTSGAPTATDMRFWPLIGTGWADSYSEAIETALRDFEAKREDRQREQAALALAEPGRVNTGSGAAVGAKWR
jgi:hypothetical protein